jgi:hypothetical protein
VGIEDRLAVVELPHHIHSAGLAEEGEVTKGHSLCSWMVAAHYSRHMEDVRRM